MGFEDFISPVTDLIGGWMNRDQTQKTNDQNELLQKEFAKNSIRWRVEDAKAAGIHPLYALGAPTMSATPSFVGDSSMGQAVANAGQNIGRAINATRTNGERQGAVMEGLQLRNMELQNENLEAERDLKRSQMALARAPGTGPGMAGGPFSPGFDGQGDAMDISPLKRTKSASGMNSSEAGWIPDSGWTRTNSGGLAPVASKDVKERIEDSFIPEMMWSWRNQITPNLPWNWGNQQKAPPRSMLPKWASKWYWSMRDQEYKPVRGYLNERR